MGHDGHELVPEFVHFLQTTNHLFMLGCIADRGYDEDSLGGFDWAQSDLNGEFPSVFAKAMEFKSNP